MKLNPLIKCSILIFVILFCSCQKINNETKAQPNSNVNIEFGRPETFQAKQSKTLQIGDYHSYKALTEEIQELNCQSKTPIIKIVREEQTRTFYLKDACLKNYGCILIKEKNVIEVFKEGILKSGKLYPANELYDVLQKDLNNFGQNPNWSDHSKKVIVYLSLWDDEVNATEQKLIEISDAYQDLDSSYKFNLYLRPRMIIPPPPPPKLENTISN